MALTESSAIDQITVTEAGAILVRQANTVLRDGVPISTNYHRSSYEPGAANITDADPKVQAIAATVWTPEVIAAFEVLRLANLPPTGG